MSLMASDPSGGKGKDVDAIVQAARRMVGAYSREVTARAQWAEKTEPWSPESKAMFQMVLDRERETANFAIELGRLVFEGRGGASWLTGLPTVSRRCRRD